MTEKTQRVRRRASRAAGPAKGKSSEAVTSQVDVPAQPKQPAKPVKALKRVKPPLRRQPHRVLVGWISFAAALLATGALAGGLAFMLVQQRHAESEQARDQRFVDTATQTVVNMFSYKLFLGVDGLHTEKGVTTHYEREAILNRMMAEVAQQVIAVTDSSKFGRMCLHKIIDLDEIDVLVTDTGADEAALEAVRLRDIEVIAV